MISWIALNIFNIIIIIIIMQLLLAKYLATNGEPLLQAVFQGSQWSGLEESPSIFKNRRTIEHLEAWKDKPLHGQFIRQLNDGIDVQ